MTTTVDLPDTFDRTGMVDLTVPFDMFFKSVPDGARVVFPTDARFRLDGSTTVRAEGGLVLKSRKGLRIEANGSTFVVGSVSTRNRSNILMRMCSDIQIDNLNVVGANPVTDFLSDSAYNAPLEGQHGFAIESSYGISLMDCSAERTYGDLLYIGKYTGAGDLSGKWSECIILHGGVWQYSGRQGMTVTAGRKIWIQDASLREVRRTTFDLEPATAGAGVDQLEITRMRIGRSRLGMVGANSSYRVDNVHFINNVLPSKPLAFTVEAWGFTKPKDGIKDDKNKWVGWEVSGNSSSVPDFNGAGTSATFKGLAHFTYKDNLIPMKMAPDSKGGHPVMVGAIGTDIDLADVSGNRVPGGKGQAIINGSLIPL